jgi:phage terminase Nu1 subunit (DNA packaging protein)
MTTILDTEVSDADLAALFGKAPRWIRECTSSGIISRIGRNKYALGDAVSKLIAHETSGIEQRLVHAKVRKAEADATSAELDLAEKRGDVASIKDFEFAQTNVATIIQQRMSNLPSRAVLFKDKPEAEFKDKLKAEITDALQQARIDASNLTKEAKENEQDDEIEDD